MPLPSPETTATVGGWIGATVGTIWAVIERVRSARRSQEIAARSEEVATLAGKDEIIKIKDEMIAALREEHAQFIEYRKKHHDEVQKYNSQLLVLTDENASLRARSDLTPLMQQQKEMQGVTLEILKALRELTEKVHSLCEFHDDQKQNP